MPTIRCDTHAPVDCPRDGSAVEPVVPSPRFTSPHSLSSHGVLPVSVSFYLSDPSNDAGLISKVDDVIP